LLCRAGAFFLVCHPWWSLWRALLCDVKNCPDNFCAEERCMSDLVLVHGGQHGSWCWAPLLMVFAGTGHVFDRVIALDMPGCGSKRSRDPEGLSLADIARELNDELRDMGVTQAVLLGHSIAGVLLPMMAVQAPALFSRLVYLSTAV